jgi:hypothetical protein
MVGHHCLLSANTSAAAPAGAAWLGERLGESTARAIGRLRLLCNHSDDRRDLDVVLPNGDRATVVLPDELTDATRLALSSWT